MWKVDIYKQKNTRFLWKSKLNNLGAKEHDTKKCRYWTLSVDENDKKKIERVLNFYRLKHVWYEKEWARSSNYRKQFFDVNPGPYRCRYCNKRLKKEYLQVDHLIPVSQTKKNKYARYMLRAANIKTVNDTKNLVPSCHRCNKRKGNKMGVWIIKGILGQYEWYWGIRRIILFILWSILIILLVVALSDSNSILHYLSKIRF